MPISLACPQCNKLYQLSDGLAGKKARCKDCGTVFAIPIPKPAKPSPAVDLFDGLDDGEPVSRPAVSRSTSMKFGALTVTEGETGGKSRTSKPKRRTEVDREGQEKFRKAGVGMMGFGFVAFLLPLVGLQLRVLAFIPPFAQYVISTLLITAGIGSLLLSFLPQPSRWFAMGSIGIVTLIAAILGSSYLSSKMKGPANVDPAPPPAFVGQPGLPAPMPNPFIPPQANVPSPILPPPSIETRDGNADELLYNLSNAQAAREAGPGVMIRELTFRVDYQATGNSMAGPLLFWVIESNQTKADRRMIGVDPRSGTLSGAITVTGGDTGPFKTYIARETLGPGGKSRVKVSNIVDMQWMGEQGQNDSMIPPGSPTNNTLPNPRRAFPGGMPGRPGFPRMPGRP